MQMLPTDAGQPRIISPRQRSRDRATPARLQQSLSTELP